MWGDGFWSMNLLSAVWNRREHSSTQSGHRGSDGEGLGGGCGMGWGNGDVLGNVTSWNPMRAGSRAGVVAAQGEELPLVLAVLQQCSPGSLLSSTSSWRNYQRSF